MNGRPGVCDMPGLPCGGIRFMSEVSNVQTVVVVGGGFTGAAVALHLARANGGSRPRRIVVFEPRQNPGAGLAYGTSEPTHRINVPAIKMSLYPDDPEGFQRYVEQRDIAGSDPESLDAAGQAFLRRSVFGAYVAEELAPHLASGAIVHRREKVFSVRRQGPRWLVEGEAGDPVLADAVVLAVSHPEPSLPRALQGLRGHPGLIVEGARAASLDAIGAEDRVLVIGNGLTAADVIATLDRRGHTGPIIAISRRGLRSKGHPAAPQEAFGDFLSPASTSAAQLVKRVRATVREAAAMGLSWHAVLDAVRQQGQQVWRALPVAERRRIVRHMRPYWDVHRFRIAPQVEKVLDRAVAAGRLRILAASLQAARAGPDGIYVTLRRKGGAEPGETVVDSVVVTTGPAHGAILESQAFLRGLREEGHLKPCETGLGIACDELSRAIDVAGRPADNLFIAGPLARGTFGELMGLPQVSDHAFAVAQTVHGLLQSAGRPSGAAKGKDAAAAYPQKDKAL